MQDLTFGHIWCNGVINFIIKFFYELGKCLSISDAIGRRLRDGDKIRYKVNNISLLMN